MACWWRAPAAYSAVGRCCPTATAITACNWPACRNASVQSDEPFAEVLAAVEAGDRIGRALDAVQHVFRVAQAALAQPAHEVGARRRLVRHMIEDHEALHACAL